MISSYRILLINTILILFISQVNGGHWVCDWVNGRGWMYCSRGICNKFLGKRSVSMDDEQTSVLQNDDGSYCLDENFCYTCQPISNNACRLILNSQYFPLFKSYLFNKRSDKNICS